MDQVTNGLQKIPCVLPVATRENYSYKYSLCEEVLLVSSMVYFDARNSSWIYTGKVLNLFCLEVATLITLVICCYMKIMMYFRSFPALWDPLLG